MAHSAPLRSPEPARVTAVTPEMLAAGKMAFLEKRVVLDDLHQYFPADLEEFLSHIFTRMAAAA